MLPTASLILSKAAFFFLLVGRTKAQQQCSVCAGGESITLPEKEISIPGFEFINSCSDLNDLVPVLLPDETAVECQVVRDLGTLCGCPRKENSCNLCPNGSSVGNPALEVPFIFQQQFQGITPTCELFEAFLHNVDQTNSTCSLAKQVLSDYCGCSSSSSSPAVEDEEDASSSPCQLCPGGDPITFPNKTLDIEGFPLQNCQELDDATLLFLKTGSETCDLLQSVGSFCGCPTPMMEDRCTLCRDGSKAVNQSRTMPFLEEEFGFVPTCALFEAALLSTEQVDSEQCVLGRFFGSHCGCPPIEDHCYICGNDGDAMATLDKEIPQFERFIPFTPTCELIQSFQYQVKPEEDICRLTFDQRWRCGCNDGHFDYFGADTVTKQAFLVWIPRVAGIISICGSLYILYDILSQQRKKKLLAKTYPQLMVAIAVFDLVNSAGWAFSTLPIPQYDEYGHETNIYGARGNEATCTAQGFFIQLGYTGIFYNLSLSLYYYLVIVMSWKETRLKKMRKFLHLVPLAFGFSLAFAGIPHYDIDILACYIVPPPLAETWTNIVVFAMAPISFVIIFLTVVMSLVYWKVRKNRRAGNKWQGQQQQQQPTADKKKKDKKDKQKKKKKTRDALEHEVLWQCVFYVCSFYVSWPILLAANGKSDYPSYPFWVVVMLLTPIQGLSNCVVYVRPRLLRYLRMRKKMKGIRRERPTTDVSNDAASAEPGESRNYSSNLLHSSATAMMHFGRNRIMGPVANFWETMREARMTRKANAESRRHLAEALEGEYVGPDIAIAEDDEEEDGEEFDRAAALAMLQTSKSVPGHMSHAWNDEGGDDDKKSTTNVRFSDGNIDAAGDGESEASLTLDDLADNDGAQPNKPPPKRYASLPARYSRTTGAKK